MLAIIKLWGTTLGLAGLVVAQATGAAESGSLPSWLDTGVAVAAVLLLGYLILMLVRGDIVSLATIKAVVSQAVQEALEDERRRPK